MSNFIFKRVMSTESELLLWKGMGLPSDDLSQENSLVIANSSDRLVGVGLIFQRIILRFYLYVPRCLYEDERCIYLCNQK